jgi:hypothetical protein
LDFKIGLNHCSLAASLGGLKGAVVKTAVKSQKNPGLADPLAPAFNAGQTLSSNRLAAFTPLGPVLDDPVGQCPFKPDISSGFFGLDPLVFQNLLSLSLEFAVERGILQQIASREVLFRFVSHNRVHHHAAVNNQSTALETLQSQIAVS